LINVTEFDYFRATVLALIQGLTEFLPISSSAHLIFPSQLMGWDDQGLAFDVAVHLGTLAAVLWYFRQQVLQLSVAWCQHVFTQKHSAESHLAWLIMLATLPAVIAGFLLKGVVETWFRHIAVIAVTTIVFGGLLWMAEKHSRMERGMHTLTWRVALVIGMAQVLALVPGTSRSGITMTAALFCHLDRDTASRFSFLLSIPVIAGAALLMTVDLLREPVVDWLGLAYATILSAIVAYLCIHYFLKFINTIGFLPFVLYRLLLGASLLLFMLM
jgi:undecaprenyl-diphosphatase